MQTRAYAATASDAPLAPATLERREPGPHDVLIEITYAGICHSDIHTVRGEWGQVDYPLTPGHEIIGTVTQVGEQVSRYHVGDVVGVGCMVNSCRMCPSCQIGQEQYCTSVVWTYGSTDRDDTMTQGGYSRHVVVNEDFVVSIPAALHSPDLLPAATPLLCAGITLYSPMRYWNVGPGTNVAIVGMGGLGHVGVRIASAMGAHVTVLSHSHDKYDDAVTFGAHRFAATSDPETLPKLQQEFDIILNTVSAALDLSAYLATLRPNGVFVELGLPQQPLNIPAFSLTGGRKAVAGSGIGSIAETQQMLDFCAHHGITAQIELITAEQINDTYERVINSTVRYRAVIDATTF